MKHSAHSRPVGIRISPQVLEQVCREMIKVILYALPHAVKGTIYAVGPIPDLRVLRVASGHRDGESENILWDRAARSGYDLPGKVWDDYRDRPGGMLEAMAWCVERQRSWTADDPERDIRSARKQREGKADEDHHHMEPVLVRKSELWDYAPPLEAFPKDGSGHPIWQDSRWATVAVVKIHFPPQTIRQGDRSTRIIKELSHSLGTQMLSLHAREVALEKEYRLTRECLDTQNTLAHEFRNLASRIGFAYRAVNNEISFLRESWEDLVHRHHPDQPNRRNILRQLNDILVEIEATRSSDQKSEQISKLATTQGELMESCLLPRQNQMWFREKIQPLWSYILSTTDLPEFTKRLIAELLDALVRSFHIGQDESLRRGIGGISEAVKNKWVDLAYREFNSRSDGTLKEYIEFLSQVRSDLPRGRYSLNNLLCLKFLVDLLPEVERRLNGSLERLKNNG